MTNQLADTPHHVAIIMDGNGRWAVNKGRPRTYGHHRGAERVRELVDVAPDLGIKVLTLFAFSTENFRRPGYEVRVLMSLFRRYIAREVDGLDAEGVQVRFIGDRTRLPRNLQNLMDMMETRTAANSRMILQLAISYGSRDEITNAVQSLAREVAAGRLDPDAIDQDAISRALYTGGVADPDLVIRTSGEQRISNFLLWQSAYAEYAFIDECFPDFSPERLAELCGAFGTRERRFGALAAS
ncbi:MAG: polyprenyl diphosphate synthase [Paracoccaceae bacterium]